MVICKLKKGENFFKNKSLNFPFSLFKDNSKVLFFFSSSFRPIIPFFSIRFNKNRIDNEIESVIIMAIMILNEWNSNSIFFPILLLLLPLSLSLINIYIHFFYGQKYSAFLHMSMFYNIWFDEINIILVVVVGHFFSFSDYDQKKKWIQTKQNTVVVVVHHINDETN